MYKEEAFHLAGICCYNPNMENQVKDMIEGNSAASRAEAFLQSRQWNEFQGRAGRKTFFLEKEGMALSAIGHLLPLVGKYLYCPRGPIIETKDAEFQTRELIDLAKKENAGWIRIEPENQESLELIRNCIAEKIVRAPHDVQPKEIFVVDISKPEEMLLGEMKAKTRYNIGLAKKKGVRVNITNGSEGEHDKRYLEAFLKLTREMALRNRISAHSEDYYRKMIQGFPDNIRIYTAEYEGEIIAANLVLFYGQYATYLHGASGNSHRNVMAPFLLQWQAILDAKEKGCRYYDFGGVQTPGVKHQKHSDLVGVTNFKLGFSPSTKAIEFPGSYDIIINPRRYAVYRGLQRAKSFAIRFRK